ncbi:MAG: pseudouridine synthase [Eubacteriales bacterium]|nr:pseudouridine synthase [Eubacteriales bacterium]
MGKIRLDKYLADAGCGTRSEVKLSIRKGKVTVNGENCRSPEQKVDPEADEIEVDGIALSWKKHEYLMLHKPAGCVTATRDNHDQTVMDLIGGTKRKELFPVGRLDKDTEGLLLITDDGELAHRLLAPNNHVDKTYFVRVSGVISEKGAEMLTQGMDIGEKSRTLPAKLEILRQGECSEALLTIREGKFHQVKRMFHGIGNEVLYLKRLSMGSLTLDEGLEPGKYRELTEEELRSLREEVHLNE